MRIRTGTLILIFILGQFSVSSGFAGPDSDREQEEAVSLAEKISAQKEEKIQKQKAEADTRFRQALVFYQAEDWKEAKSGFEEALRLNPVHQEAKRYLKRCQLELSKEAAPPEREADSETAEIEGLLSQAEKFLSQGSYAQAREAAEKILSLASPAERGYRQAQAIIERAKTKELAAEKKRTREDAALNEEDVLLEVEKAWVIPPAPETAVTEEVAEEAYEIRAEIEKKLEQVVSLDFNQVHLREVINRLNAEYGVNLVLDERIFADGSEQTLTTEVSPLVSVYLKDITLAEALEVILRTKRLKFRIEENLVWITSRENLLTEEPVTRIFQLSTTVEDIEEIIYKSIPSWPEEQTSLKYDPNSNTLVITHVPAYVELVRDIVRHLDVIPLQVSIRTRFMEIEESALKELSIALSDLSEYGYKLLDSDAYDVGVDTKFQGVSTSGEGGRIRLDYWKLQDSAFWAVVEALEGSDRSKLLSCPQVTTLNNHQAVIRVIQPLRYPTKYQIRQNTVEETTTTGRTISLRHDRVLPSGFRTKDVGITLTVTPSVGADRRTITLTLVPEIIEHVDWREFVNVSVGDPEGTTLEQDRWVVKTPIFYTRSVTTSILVDDGETIIIGGLIKENEIERTDEVPYLSEIPLLGNLFKRTYSSTEKSNLLIFVTAHILTPTGQKYIR